MSKKESTPLSVVERIKRESHGLRGTITNSLSDAITGQVQEDDTQVVKFHGMYQQDDRDVRKKGPEEVRKPIFFHDPSTPSLVVCYGGTMDGHTSYRGEHSTGVIKITTRQTIQLHGILKSHIKPTIQSFNAARLDSIATCGDINRNVTSNALPSHSPLHQQVHAYADKISTLLMPKQEPTMKSGWMKNYSKKKRTKQILCMKTVTCLANLKLVLPFPQITMWMCSQMISGLSPSLKNDVLKGFNIAIGGGYLLPME